MAEATPAVDFAAAKGGKPLDYDAFLSYAHRDKDVTTAIQKGLHRIGRRVGQLRSLRVFRDDTNLTANPDLWGKITDALDNSRFMIVVLSPQSATSNWVNEEVSYWLQHRGHDQLMLVLAEGELQWDSKDARFDPQSSNAALPRLTEPGSLPVEPLYIDVSGDAPWDLRDLAFRDKATSLAAPIHGKPKDELAGDDVREQRRFRRLRRAAMAGLAVLTVVTLVAAVIAFLQRQEAIRHLHDAVAAKLNAEGASMLAGTMPGGDVRGLQELLAANAIQAHGVPILSAQVARFTTQKIIGFGATPHALAYSPDGHRIVIAQEDGTLQQLDPATSKPVGAPMKGTGMLTGVTYTSDGRTIASASNDGTMRLWNADTGEALNPDPQRVESLQGIAVSPKGNIATGSGYDTIRIWDPQNGKLRAIDPVFSDRTARISDLAYDRGGNLLAVSGFNGDIAIIDLATRKPHVPIIVVTDARGRSTPAWKIAFSPDGHTLAVGGANLQLWNADTGTLIRTIQPGTQGVTEIQVAYSPDGRRIATGRADGALQLWDADTGRQLGQTQMGHTGTVLSMAFSPDGRQIATNSSDGTLRFWSATVGQAMTGPEPALAGVAFSPDGHRVAALGDTAVEQWDVTSGESQPPLTIGGTGYHYFGYVDGGRIVTATSDGTVQFWDANTGQPAQPPVHVNFPVASGTIRFALSSDGRTLAWARADDGAVALWDLTTGQMRGQPMTVEPATHLNGLAFSPDGRRLLVSYDDGLRLWNTETTQLDGTAMTNGASKGYYGAVAFSRDGNTIAAARRAELELWDPNTHKQLPDSPLHGHTAIIQSVAFGAAHQLASGAGDETLRLWDTTTGQPTAAPQMGSDLTAGVAISPDARLVAWATLDGIVRLSPASADPSQLCDKLPANMSHKQWHDWVSPSVGYITVCPGLPVKPD